MGSPVSLRDDFDAAALRSLARRTRDARRSNGGSMRRGSAVSLQTVRDAAVQRGGAGGSCRRRRRVRRRSSTCPDCRERADPGGTRGCPLAADRSRPMGRLCDHTLQHARHPTGRVHGAARRRADFRDLAGEHHANSRRFDRRRVGRIRYAVVPRPARDCRTPLDVFPFTCRQKIRRAVRTRSTCLSHSPRSGGHCRK